MINKMAYRGAFDLFEDSKKLVLENKTAFFVIIFLPTLISFIGELLASSVRDTSEASFSTALGLYGFGLLLTLLLLPAGFYLELKASQGKKVDPVSAFKKSAKYFWRVVGLSMAVGLLILLGFVALIVPGIIMIRRYFLAPFFLIDRDLSISEAMKQSAEATKGKSGAVWSVIGVMILLSLTGAVPVVGTLVSGVLLTLYTCAPALRYFELTK